MNMISLLQTKTPDTARMEIFASVAKPFPQFWAGPGDKATTLGSWMTHQPAYWVCYPVCQRPIPKTNTMQTMY